MSDDEPALLLRARTGPGAAVADRRYPASRRTFLTNALALGAAAAAAPPVFGRTAGRRALTLDDFARYVQLDNLRLSPDGEQILYEAARDAPEIWRIALNTQRPNPVRVPTMGAAARAADWRPAFGTISYLAPVDGKAQLWLSPSDTGRAVPVTSSAYGITAYAWSPDGQRIAYTESRSREAIAAQFGPPRWKDERPGAESLAQGRWQEAGEARPDGDLDARRRYLAANVAAGKATLTTFANYHDRSNRRIAQTFSRLMVLDLQTGDVRELTRRFGTVANPVWMPDGKAVLVDGHSDFEEEPDRDRVDALTMTVSGEIIAYDVQTAQPRIVARRPGWTLFQPVPSPDGRFIAYSTERSYGFAPDPTALISTEENFGVAIVPSDGGEPWYATESIDRPCHLPVWARDGRSLLVSMHDEGYAPLARIELDPRRVVKLGQKSNGFRWDFRSGPAPHMVESRRGLVAIVGTRRQPGELCLVEDGGRSISVLTRHNAWFADIASSDPIEIDTMVDGFLVRSWLYPPIDRKLGATYPLIVHLHGGPDSPSGPFYGYAYADIPYYNALGYAYLVTDFRGTSGYGRAALDSNRGHHGDRMISDAVASLEKAASLPWIDADRVVVTGSSNGGFMSTRVAAASRIVPKAVVCGFPADWASYLGESAIWPAVFSATGVNPAHPDAAESYARNGIFRMIRDIRSPVLIIYGEQDMTTGAAPAKQLFRALKYLRKPVELVSYPTADHYSGGADPLDFTVREREFFERFIDAGPKPDRGVTGARDGHR